MIQNSVINGTASSLAFLLLFLSLLASYWPARPYFWVGLLLVSSVLAYAGKMINIYAAMGILLFFILTSLANGSYWPQAKRLAKLKGVNSLAIIAVVILAFLLGSHQWPGFNNWLLVPDTQGSAGKVSYPLFANYDKAVAGLILFAMFRPAREFRLPWRQTLVYSMSAAVIAIVLLIPLAISLSISNWYPRYPDWLPLWIVCNLLITCIAEEALFRGLIQVELEKRLKSYFQQAAYAALILTSLLFAVAHLSGGFVYASLALLAGGIYGWVYLKSQRLEAPVLTHFLLNLAIVVTTLRVNH